MICLPPTTEQPAVNKCPLWKFPSSPVDHFENPPPLILSLVKSDFWILRKPNFQFWSDKPTDLSRTLLHTDETSRKGVLSSVNRTSERKTGLFSFCALKKKSTAAKKRNGRLGDCKRHLQIHIKNKQIHKYKQSCKWQIHFHPSHLGATRGSCNQLATPFPSTMH